ncbi:MAG TPA: sensor histidine kinase [Trebonia sp.]
MNLIANAAKFTREGSRVVISARAAEDGVALSIADQGSGIAPEARERIFERWHRGTTAPGLSLGLTIVSQIVALHGGRVEVNSKPDQGSTFTLILPR